MLFGYYELINTVGIHSQFDDSFNRKNKIGLSNFKQVKINKKTIKKYHLSIDNNNCMGSIYTDKKDNVVGYIAVYKYDDSGSNWLRDFEVDEKYRGHGISEELIKEAIYCFGARHVSVNKNNKIALHVLEKYGFEIYKESDIMYYLQREK